MFITVSSTADFRLHSSNETEYQSPPPQVISCKRWIVYPDEWKWISWGFPKPHFHHVNWNIKPQTVIMILTCTVSLCRSEWCTAVTSFLRVRSLSVYVASPRGFLICVGESDPSQTPQNRSYSLVVLLALCSVFIFVPSPLAFLLPLPAILPLIERFPQHLSVFSSPLSLERLFSFYVWVYVRVFE